MGRPELLSLPKMHRNRYSRCRDFTPFGKHFAVLDKDHTQIWISALTSSQWQLSQRLPAVWECIFLAFHRPCAHCHFPLRHHFLMLWDLAETVSARTTGEDGTLTDDIAFSTYQSKTVISSGTLWADSIIVYWQSSDLSVFPSDYAAVLATAMGVSMDIRTSIFGQRQPIPHLKYRPAPERALQSAPLWGLPSLVVFLS